MTTRQRLLVRGTLVVFAILGVVAGLVILGVVPPTSGSFYPKCMSYSLAGIHCPGCGMTRAVHLALNGRFAEALSQNVLFVVAVPYLFVSFLRGLWHYLWQIPHTPSKVRLPKWVTVLLIVSLAAYGIARNVPAYPFNLLAPHELTPTVASAPDSSPT